MQENCVGWGERKPSYCPQFVHAVELVHMTGIAASSWMAIGIFNVCQHLLSSVVT